MTALPRRARVPRAWSTSVASARCWQLRCARTTCCSGMINVYRREVRPFSDKQIALLQNFAAQAVIAMENARLIDRDARGVGAADRDRRGIAGHQLLARRPHAGVRRDTGKGAHALCGAAFGSLLTYDGECFQVGRASHGAGWLTLSCGSSTFVRPRVHPLARGCCEGEPLVHIADVAQVAGRIRTTQGFVRSSIWRHAAPSCSCRLRKDDVLLGAISAISPEVRPFTDKQIALLQNFAAQAVIAMENARLIDELRERTDAAETARGEAEAANEAKSTFLATMSHEIRTPMNGVLGMMEVLERQGLDDAQRPLVATMRDSAQALLRIIDDVLDFSKIEAGRLELEETAFSLSGLVAGAIDTLRAAGGRQGSGDRGRDRARLRRCADRRSDADPADPVQPVEQCGQVHRARRDHRARRARHRSAAGRRGSRSRSRTPASASTRRSRRACSSRFRRPTARRHGAMAAPGSASRSSAGWRS